MLLARAPQSSVKSAKEHQGLRYFLTPKGAEALNSAAGVFLYPRKQSKYTLFADELAICERIASERRQRNAVAGMRDAMYATGRASSDVDFQGVVGEMAFNRFFGNTDTELYDTTPRRASTETGFDGRVGPNACTVDVKCTAYANVPIKVTRWKASNLPRLFALQTVAFYGHDGKPVNVKALKTTGGTTTTLFAATSRAEVTFRGVIAASELMLDSNLVVDEASGKQYYQLAQNLLREVKDYPDF
jgi:hypothetical protein